ncbi:hypothetical protein, partial [Halorubrum sp. Atlit-26R]|uniref:hypothetical protein n=1 Tax=Halorubrum sp. Atlit-26R TaxID=2282128 RepID=UPI001F383113
MNVSINVLTVTVDDVFPVGCIVSSSGYYVQKPSCRPSMTPAGRALVESYDPVFRQIECLQAFVGGDALAD